MRRKLKRYVNAVYRRLIPTGGVASKTIRSGIWAGLMNFGDRALQMLLMLILARLLGPRAFGLMSISLLALSALRRFSNLGVDAAIIQQKETDVDEYLNTAWILKIARGVLLFGVLFAIAPFIAGGIFDEPAATPLIRVIGLSPLFVGLQNPGIVYFRKNLDFHKQFVYQMSGSLAHFCVGIGIAILDASVWALIFAFVASDAMKMVVSYIVHGYRPWPEFHVPIAHELIGYGKWITGTSIIYFLYGEGDDAFVGWLVGATALGFYSYAYQLSNAPATEVTQIVSNVMFPAYSQLQENTEHLREAFFQALQVTSFIAFPMSFGIAAVSPVFVEAFLGEDWLPMVPVMQILAVYGLLRAIGVNFGPVWKAVGRPDYITKLSAVRVICIALTIWPLTARFNIVGTAICVTGVYLFPMMPLDLYFISRSIETPIPTILKDLSYPFVASAAMAAAVVLTEIQVSTGPIAEFALLVLVGVVTYPIAVALLAFRFGWEIDENIQRVVSAMRG